MKTVSFTCHRITSACAENTSHAQTRGTPSRNHLRMCGEHFPVVQDIQSNLGSPPHVRRTHIIINKIFDDSGITSACAENTYQQKIEEITAEDHLRMCGEHFLNNCSTCHNLGSPPHVRRTLLVDDQQTGVWGITSACAENTAPDLAVTNSLKDHLRMCGEHATTKSILVVLTGSPPHVRRTLSLLTTFPFGNGITSACAENTKSRC